MALSFALMHPIPISSVRAITKEDLKRMRDQLQEELHTLKQGHRPGC